MGRVATAVAVCLLVGVGVARMPAWRAGAQEADARVIKLRVLSGDREVAKLGVRNGATARVSGNDAEVLYLTPSLTANGVELVVAAGPVGGGAANAAVVGRYSLTFSLAVDVGTARTSLQIEWLDTTSGPATAPGSPSCRECCLTCDGWTMCACEVIMPCGRCCCPDTCGCLPDGAQRGASSTTPQAGPKVRRDPANTMNGGRR
jgi:hypothetical protein